MTSGRVLARNTFFTFVGYGAPLLVAVFAIPLLIGGLGTDRFGVITLAWAVMGYFSLFDFGLGRATTRFVAEYYARDETEDLPELIWSSVVIHVGLGVMGGVVLASFTPWLTQYVLNIPASLLGETRSSFYLLAASVPLVVATASLRGVLEAIQRFDLVNAVKVPASVINYLAPLLVLLFTDNLTAIVGVLVASRGIVLLIHLLLCLRVLPVLLERFGFEAARMKPLIGFGSWLTVSSFVNPSIVTLDRFMIGAFVSLSAVTLYATPYEVVTKLWIFSASLLGVLFPAFSYLGVRHRQELRRLYGRACKYLLVLVAPIVGVTLALAYDLLSAWVGEDFARDSTPVAQWLVVGVLINVLAQVPFTLLQTTGKAGLIAKLQLIQLPFYVIAIWYLIGSMGITGVAMVWALRAAVEAAMFFIVAEGHLPAPVDGEEDYLSWSHIGIVSAFLLLFFGASSLLPDTMTPKVAVVAGLLGVFVLWEWLFFLKKEERKAFIGEVKSVLKRPR